MLYSDAPFIDPLLSIPISLLMIYNVFKNLKRILVIILKGTPENVNLKEVWQKIYKLDEIVNIHDRYAWSMDGNYIILTAHLALDQGYNLCRQAEINKRLKGL
ncbi:MAG: hypothetical protein ACFB2Y_20985 [Fulvivirga sp.]